MSDAAICLKSIYELLPETFFVPSYQRGYRWTPQQVEQLLDDLWEFKQSADKRDKSVFYCLQPLVVKRRGPDWELVDGQQRLTTIRLILHSLRKLLETEEITSFSLSFETREATSGAFLQNIDPSRREENIDYHHICEAHEAIERWFKRPDAAPRRKIFDCLLDDERSGQNVKVIWYQLGDHESAVDAFTRLNVGKIPLNNAELIRGLFLRASNYAVETGPLRQLKIAQEWDAIEKTLQRDEVWYFLHHGKNSPPNRIDYLFELMAHEEPVASAEVPANLPARDDPHHTFFFYHRKFETWDAQAEKPQTRDAQDEKDEARAAHAEKLWLEVKKYFMTLEEWFSDRALYHLIGYLIHESTDQKQEILALRAAGEKIAKGKFERVLKERIFSRLLDKELGDQSGRQTVAAAIRAHAESLDYESSRGRKNIRSCLLLFNIASLVQDPASNLRFPFDAFKKENWDIEHVRSVDSKRPRWENEQREWLGHVREFLDDVAPDADADPEDTEAVAGVALNQRIASLLQASEFDADLFKALYDDLLRHFREDRDADADHDIGNLVLLDAETNRSYKNAVFPVKRRRILGLEKRGVFVPLGTKNAFLKCYTRRIRHMMFWSEADNREYVDAIVAVLTNFFHPAKEGSK